MAETTIRSADLISNVKLKTLVEKVSRLSSPPVSIVVLGDSGKVIAKACRFPGICQWTRERFEAGPGGLVASSCPSRDCPFAKGQVRVPIEVQGEVVGQILGSSDNRSNTEIATKLVGDIVAASAYGEFELNSLSMELLDRYEEVNLLYDVGESLGSVFDADTIYEIVLGKGTTVIGAQKALIMMLEEEGGGLHLVASRGLSEEEATRLAVWVEEGIGRDVAKEAKPLLVEEGEPLLADLPQGKDVNQTRPRFSSSIMCAPLKTTDTVLGIICMMEKASHEMFTAGDLKLLSAIASQAAISIHNSKLIQELRESERIKRDMEIAQRIQMSLLPDKPPHFGGVELAGRCIPAKNVGGDYYDFFTISEDELGIVIADVSGHSVGAALVMAATRSVLRSEAFQNGNAPEILARTNAIMFGDLAAAELFITMFYLRYNRGTGELTYANGGHNLPFICRAEGRQCVPIDADGMPLGILDDVRFDLGRAQIGTGDILILYTDGVTEARSRTGEQLGEDRLHRIVQRNSKMTAQELLDVIYDEVYQHSRSMIQNDDITLVVMKVVGG